MTPVQLLLGKIALLGVLILAVFMSGHRMGAKGIQADWDAYKVKAIAAQDKRIAENEQHNADVQAMHDAYNVKVATDHEASIVALNKKYDADVAAVRAAGGLRIPRTVCNRVETGTETASDGGHHEDASATVELPREIEDNLFSEAKRADEIVEHARACQSWIRQNGFFDLPN